LDEDIRAAAERHDYNMIIQRLHLFCSNELSAFYFDIRKDRLYCDRPDGFERRACRTVLYHLFECLVTWFAPILVYTCEEAWEYRPSLLAPDKTSVHQMVFPTIPKDWKNSALESKWDKVRDIRRVVLAALEPKRADKTIGSSLEAHPHVYITADYEESVKDIDLAEIAITSQASIHGAPAPEGATTLSDVVGVGVVFAKAEGQKCERCWKILPTVGQDPEFPGLSPRDADVVRYFATLKKAA
jgi:isoleucyl-tRNA synthetase